MIYRIKHGYNQTELAKRIYVSKSTVSNWEKGISEPKFDQLEGIAAALDCSLSELLGREVKVNDKKEIYTYSLQYQKYRHDKNIFRNIMLASVLVLGFLSFVFVNQLLFDLSIFISIVYVISEIIIWFIDSKSSNPSIHYSIDEKLVYKHKSSNLNFVKEKRRYVKAIIFQLFLVLFSFFVLVGTTYEKIELDISIFITIIFLVIFGWTIFLIIEGFYRSYIQSEIDYSKIRKNFGMIIFKINLILAIIYLATFLIIYNTLEISFSSFWVKIFLVGMPSLYLLVAWAIHYSQSKFYSKFILYSYNIQSNTYKCLEKVE